MKFDEIRLKAVLRARRAAARPDPEQ